jgi:ABC-2 type transport system permease protein
MLTAVKNQGRVLLLSVKYNIMREMTNHVTFLMNVLFMILNNASFIIQWVILFQLKDDIGGYGFRETMTLWGLASSTFGISHIFFHRVYELPELIMHGKLDAFLVQPKNVLLSVISSGTSPSAIGDLIYGYLVLCFFNFSLTGLLLFTLMSILGGILLTAFAVIVGSISFWIVRGDMVAYNLTNSIVHISTYPEGIFKNGVRLILYTLIPVGLANYLPLKVILHFRLWQCLLVLASTVLMVLLAFLIFYRGLKRYSSSSLMIARI